VAARWERTLQLCHLDDAEHRANAHGTQDREESRKGPIDRAPADPWNEQMDDTEPE
jgi:hypothetical protein